LFIYWVERLRHSGCAQQQSYTGDNKFIHIYQICCKGNKKFGNIQKLYYLCTEFATITI